MSRLYCQLPARSPIRAAGLVRRCTLELAADPRDRLRQELERMFGAGGSILTASGTHALTLALTAIRATDRPVLLPGYSCFEVATAAAGAGVPVALYDLDPETLEPDWTSVRAAAARGAAALVVAPLYGLPLRWDLARAVADELGVPLIEDAAQSQGTMWQGRPVGSFGNFSVLSFGRGKGWTGAGGGALLWRDPQPVPPEPPRAVSPGREIQTTASAIAQWLLGRPALYGMPSALPWLSLGETVYHEPSTPAPMSRTSAALIRSNRDAAAREVLRRRDMARLYNDALRNAQAPGPGLIGARFDGDSGALRYPLRIRGGWDLLKSTEARTMGAAPGYPQPLSDLAVLQPVRVNVAQQLPGARLLAAQTVTLPTHSLVSASEAERLVRLVRERIAET